MKTTEQLTPARKSMIKALKLTMSGNILLAQKELKKAQRELNKQYKSK
jgi:hypothetical protein